MEHLKTDPEAREEKIAEVMKHVCDILKQDLILEEFVSFKEDKVPSVPFGKELDINA